MEKPASTDTYEWFLHAVKEIDNIDGHLRQKRYDRVAVILRCSAGYLCHALIAAKGKPDEPGDLDAEKKLYAELERLYGNQEPELLGIIQAALFTDPKSQDLKDLYARYSRALVTARSIIANETGYRSINDKLRSFLGGVLKSRAGRKKTIIIITIIIVLGLVPLLIYSRSQPYHETNLIGEMFWTSNVETAFNIGNSGQFPVGLGNQVRDYYAVLHNEGTVYQVRFDPVNDRDLALIEIENIQLYNKKNESIHKSTPLQLQGWTLHSLKALPGNDEIFRLQVTGKDPYLVSPVLNQESVKVIGARMRVMSKMTFWEWVFGIKR